jgi:integrase/recombinase XerD
LYKRVLIHEILYHEKQKKSPRKLPQRSKSASNNYARSIAKVALHFGTDPIDLSIEQINDYLYSMLKQDSSPSKSYFHHKVDGLKCLFKMMG